MKTRFVPPQTILRSPAFLGVEPVVPITVASASVSPFVIICLNASYTSRIPYLSQNPTAQIVGQHD